MSRVIILVADGLGIGSAPDAEQFGDQGANTFGHIAQHMLQQGGSFNIPNLTKLGLVAACEQANEESLSLPEFPLIGSYGYMQEISSGKDTPSGHWEMAGVPVLFEWGYFTDKTNSFPEQFLNQLCERTGVDGILGNCHMPGTDALVRYGEEHCRTGKPICYTSVDSVFQIAAHEQFFGLDKLYHFCETARELLDEYNIGRVIARPFLGETSTQFKRTGNRRDYSVLPPAQTVLQRLTEAGGHVTSIGKISDIYAHQGISKQRKATGLAELMDTTLDELSVVGDNSIVFTNLVNFDQDYGHRRNIQGFGEALEYFDTRLSELFLTMKDDDWLFITADHGCDPAWQGTDHTREFVPIIAYQPGLQSVQLGKRKTFADLGQSIAEIFGLQNMQYGQSFMQLLNKN